MKIVNIKKAMHIIDSMLITNLYQNRVYISYNNKIMEVIKNIIIKSYSIESVRDTSIHPEFELPHVVKNNFLFGR